MHDHEYETMRRVEDTYWWYQALRDLVARRLRERLPRNRPIGVLDAGCGTGGMLEQLRVEAPQWGLAGADVSPFAVTHTQERGFDEVQLASIEAMPFASERFDAVISLDVLYHEAVNEQRALTELRRVMKPGAVLILNLPAFDCLAGQHDVAVQGARRYTGAGVRRLLEQGGWQIEKIHYWNAWLFLPVLAWRWLSRLRVPSRNDAARSDLGLLPPPLNALLIALAGIDQRLCAVLPVPFGTSVFAMARKPTLPSLP